MSADHDDFEQEPIPGLPEHLPEGEDLLWQGKPTPMKFARRAMRLNWLVGYFGFLLAWCAATTVYDGHSFASFVLEALAVSVAGAAVVGFFAWFGHATAKHTIYTITSRRLVVRHGIVMPMTVNIPFSQLRSAQLRSFGDGTGDIVVTPNFDARVPYLAISPHCRPLTAMHPEPMLRSVPHAQSVAALLSRAMGGAIATQASLERAGARAGDLPAPVNSQGHGANTAHGAAQGPMEPALAARS
ncbi:MAG: photosynthetic complex putative assembly protein PuhB [Pseudomonadota bacterium]